VQDAAGQTERTKGPGCDANEIASLRQSRSMGSKLAASIAVKSSVLTRRSVASPRAP